jgi:hypothetical protein
MVTATATCQWCSEGFTYERSDPRGRVKRWCSEKCRYAQRDSERRPMCAGGCGRPVWIGKGSRPDAMCRPCRNREQRITAGLSESRERKCASCGASFRPVKPRPGRQYCSDPICRATYQGAAMSSPWPRRGDPRNARRVARRKLRSSLVPGKGDEAIFHRDRWRCHLCDLPVSRTLKHPHPMSPSIDHVVPVDDGGTDDPANLATAHLACNIHKHTAAMGEQLRLVG